MSNKHRVVTRLAAEQNIGKEIVLVSVLVALGVNLCSTGLVEILGLTSNSYLFVHYWSGNQHCNHC